MPKHKKTKSRLSETWEAKRRQSLLRKQSSLNEIKNENLKNVTSNITGNLINEKLEAIKKESEEKQQRLENIKRETRKSVIGDDVDFEDDPNTDSNNKNDDKNNENNENNNNNNDNNKNTDSNTDITSTDTSNNSDKKGKKKKKIKELKKKFDNGNSKVETELDAQHKRKLYDQEWKHHQMTAKEKLRNFKYKIYDEDGNEIENDNNENNEININDEEEKLQEKQKQIEEEAAIKIQSIQRRRQSLKEYENKKKELEEEQKRIEEEQKQIEEEAAIKIQSIQRKKQALKEYENKKREIEEEEQKQIESNNKKLNILNLSGANNIKNSDSDSDDYEGRKIFRGIPQNILDIVKKDGYWFEEELNN